MTPRRWLLAGAVAVAAVTGVVWLVEPNLLVGLRSPRALAWTAAVAAGSTAVALLVRRIGAAWPVAAAVGALPGLVLATVVVVKPIVSPRRLDEALPTAPAPTAAASGTPAATASPAGEPARVATGTLRGLAGHEAKGTVTTYRLANGTHVVRFENVDIGGTPDPEVYVLPGRDRTGKRGGTHLGALKAEKGSFSYPLPASFATSGYTVVVWCERFAVDIAHATQG